MADKHKLKYYNQEYKETKREIDDALEILLNDTKNAFNSHSFEQIESIIARKKEILDLVTDKIVKQVSRTRTEESSPKNTTLYFGLLLETKDLLNATMNLLEEYHNSFDSSVEPATITVADEVKKSGASEETE